MYLNAYPAPRDSLNMAFKESLFLLKTILIICSVICFYVRFGKRKACVQTGRSSGLLSALHQSIQHLLVAYSIILPIKNTKFII